MPWDKRRRCDLPLLQGDYIGEGGLETSVNFLKITFQYLTLDIMLLGADSRRTVLPDLIVYTAQHFFLHYYKGVLEN